MTSFIGHEPKKEPCSLQAKISVVQANRFSSSYSVPIPEFQKKNTPVNPVSPFSRMR